MDPKLDNCQYGLLGSPLGNLMITATSHAITQISFADEAASKLLAISSTHSNPHLAEAIAQLQAYFDGRRTYFDFAISQPGTAFQQRVWQQLSRIPFGTTISYQQLALNLGDPNCIRAAASANGRNQLAIVVPCHRVIGSNGSLVGYAGGLYRKQYLLNLEERVSGKTFQGQLFS